MGGNYIEIAGGTITETYEKDYNIYAEGYIVIPAGKAIKEVGKNKGVSFNTPKKPPMVDPTIMDVYWMDADMEEEISHLIENKASIYVKVINVDAGETVEVTVEEETDSGTIKVHTFRGAVDESGIAEMREVFQFQ